MPFIGNTPAQVPLTSADIADGIITSAKIVDGTIVNADINASAGLVFTKLASTGTLTLDNIQFPATAVASANANNLDDYEEGTWTPSDISGASLTLTSPVGTYVKIGKCVIVTYSWRFPSTASGTAINIGNLPFTAASGNDNYQGNVSTTDYGSSDIVIWNNAGSTNIRIRNYNDSALSNANLSGKYITGQSIYFI